MTGSWPHYGAFLINLYEKKGNGSWFLNKAHSSIWITRKLSASLWHNFQDLVSSCRYVIWIGIIFKARPEKKRKISCRSPKSSQSQPEQKIYQVAKFRPKIAWNIQIFWHAMTSTGVSWTLQQDNVKFEPRPRLYGSPDRTSVNLASPSSVSVEGKRQVLKGTSTFSFGSTPLSYEYPSFWHLMTRHRRDTLTQRVYLYY